MRKTALIVLGGALVLIAAAGARHWFAGPSPAVRYPGRIEALVAPPAAAAVAPPASFEAAFQALRAEIDALRRDIDRLHAVERRLQPLLETSHAPTPGPSTPLRLPPGPQGRAAAVGDLLGLDEGRRKVFEQAHEQFVGKVRTLEANRAVLKRDGGATTVVVPAFPAQGQDLAREWEAQLRGLLVPEELRRYREHGLESTLFEGGLDGLGGADRLVTVTSLGGDRWTVVESRTGGDGGRKNQYTMTRTGSEEVLAPYRHLLDR